MKFSKWSALLFTLPLLPGLSSMAHSQTDPEIHIMNPVGFVTPGQFEEIIAEISNPVDSNAVIEGLGGMGRTTRGSLMQGFDPRVDPRASIRLVEQPGLRNDSPDVNAKSFPIYPGETAQVVLFRLNIPDDTLPGSEIILAELSVKLLPA